MDQPICHKDVSKIDCFIWKNWKGIYHGCWNICCYYQWLLPAKLTSMYPFYIPFFLSSEPLSHRWRKIWGLRCSSVGRVVSYITCIRPWFLPEQCIKPYGMVRACYSSIQKAKAEGLEVQDHPGLNSKFEATLPTFESVQDRVMEIESGRGGRDKRKWREGKIWPLWKREVTVWDPWEQRDDMTIGYKQTCPGFGSACL